MAAIAASVCVEDFTLASTPLSKFAIAAVLLAIIDLSMRRFLFVFP